MKFTKLFVVFVLALFCITSLSYAYEIIENFDKSYIYVPQDPNNETMKILVLFHNCGDKEKNPNYSREAETFNFKAEASKWQVKAEEENFFIIGFDFENYSKQLVLKQSAEVINKKIVRIIDQLKEQYNPKETKVYVAGSHYGGAIAIMFNTMFNGFDACVSMNGNELTNGTTRDIKRAKNKTYYLFQGEKNKYVTMKRCKTIKNKLAQKGANVEIISYENADNVLPESAYSDAIDKIK